MSEPLVGGPTMAFGVFECGATGGSRMTREEAEFPASLGKVAPRQLAAHGLTRFDQLADRTERELLAIYGVGPKTSYAASETALGTGGPDGAVMASRWATVTLPG